MEESIGAGHDSKWNIPTLDNRLIMEYCNINSLKGE